MSVHSHTVAFFLTRPTHKKYQRSIVTACSRSNVTTDLCAQFYTT